MHYSIHTSNPGKLAEFQQIFALFGHTIEATTDPIQEIQADPYQVITHKATQCQTNTIVDDTSLELESQAFAGVDIKHFIHQLDHHIGQKAVWSVLLAYKTAHQQVKIFRGWVKGTIVEPRGNDGFGFDRYFQPLNQSFTLAQAKPNPHNARYLACEQLILDQPIRIEAIMSSWHGKWQPQ